MGEPSKTTPIVVVFGIPGCGKTTVANKAMDLLQSRSSSEPAKVPIIRPVALDLDVCVPQWMRDNFAKGIYPSLKERQEFALACCAHVEECLQRASTDLNRTDEPREQLAAIVSFSFVNTDLRDSFRSRFPDSQWVLIQTAEDEARRRIEQRQGHFYKGKAVSTKIRETSPETKHSTRQTNAADNKEWDFAPVSFPHTILDGRITMEENAGIVVNLVRQACCCCEYRSE